MSCALNGFSVEVISENSENIASYVEHAKFMLKMFFPTASIDMETNRAM